MTLGDTSVYRVRFAARLFSRDNASGKSSEANLASSAADRVARALDGSGSPALSFQRGSNNSLNRGCERGSDDVVVVTTVLLRTCWNLPQP